MLVTNVEAPQQKKFHDVVFPLILSPKTATPEHDDGNDDDNACEVKMGAADLSEYIRKNADVLNEQLKVHGALVFRGFHLMDAEAFNFVVNQGFAWTPLPYVGGAAPRTSVIGTVFTTNESPPDSVIPFHHEMAQVEHYPRRIFFFCDVPPTLGGETPLCRSDVVYERMLHEFPAFCAKLECLGVRYVRVMPRENDNASPIGRGWQSTYESNDAAAVEAKCRELEIDIEWLPNGDLKTTTKTLPAIKVHPLTGKKVWFNSLVAAFTGWQDSRNEASKAVMFSDGTYLDERAIRRCGEIMNEVCVDLPWQKGDMFLIDNDQVMHARRTFTPPRKIYAALVK